MYRSLMALLLLLVPGVAQANPANARPWAQLCQTCHKPDNRHASVPTLDGQPSAYLFEQLMAFKEKRRDDAAMQTNASGLSEAEMRDMAAFFAARPPRRGEYPVEPAKVAQGKALAASLRCAECHKTDYPVQDNTPRLAGMHPRYAANEIIAFTRGQRPHPRIGRDSAIGYNDAIALGQYFSQLQ